MTADLAVALSGGCSFPEIHSFENGVFAVFVLDCHKCILHTALFFKGCLLLGTLALFFLIILKKAELFGILRAVNLIFGYDSAGCDIDSPYKQISVRNTLKKLRCDIDNKPC